MAHQEPQDGQPENISNTEEKGKDYLQAFISA
jgi:hypothetical protein